ncbi:hypothetical protein AWN90_07600 [Nocardia terpenica]|uniref:Cytochrome P450 n=1 Tax=Nocardia terpenica TaxID=455432 RepID=A0A164IPK5_9NOCA|nr:hypothetical protein AWN90_07600 [Nocardia terpenica]
MKFDPLSPEWIDDPYVFYSRLRHNEPVLRDDNLGAYLLFSYADCAAVLRTTDDFATDPARLGRDFPAIRKSIQLIDPPENTALRKATAEAIHAGFSALSATTGGLTEVVAKALFFARHADRPVDLITEFSKPLCLWVMCGVLGARQPDPDWFAEVSDRMVFGMDYGFRPDALEPSLSAKRELSELTDSWLDEHRDSVFFGTLLGVATTYTRDVVANSVRVVLHAGYSSVSGLIENLLLHLLVEREMFEEHRERLLESKAARITAIEEMIRYDSPVQVSKRLTVEDLELSGVDVPRGADVIALIGAANRDPTVFAEPDQMNLLRTPNPHLGFGRGPHACLGANLSIELGSAVLKAFLVEQPNMRLAAHPVRRKTASIRGLASLPVWLE